MRAARSCTTTVPRGINGPVASGADVSIANIADSVNILRYMGQPARAKLALNHSTMSLNQVADPQTKVESDAD